MLKLRKEIESEIWRRDGWTLLTTPFDGTEDSQFYRECVRVCRADAPRSGLHGMCELDTGRMVLAWHGDSASALLIAYAFERKSYYAGAAAVLKWMTKGEVDPRFAAKGLDPIEVERRMSYVDRFVALIRDSGFSSSMCMREARAEFFDGDPPPKREWISRAPLFDRLHSIYC